MSTKVRLQYCKIPVHELSDNSGRMATQYIDYLQSIFSTIWKIKRWLCDDVEETKEIVAHIQQQTELLLSVITPLKTVP